VANLDFYRRGIENATIHEELAPSVEISQIWRHVRESYEFLLKFEERAKVQDQLAPEIVR
jgi:hypothetical protein